MHLNSKASVQNWMLAITSISIILILSSCGSNKDLTPERFAKEACSCFINQTSVNIDSKLEPCLAKPINEHFASIHKIYYTDQPSDVAIKRFMMDITLIMVRSCDQFYNEVDSMYTNFYPETSHESIQADLRTIEDSLQRASDSARVKLLNRRINLLTKAREFDKASEDIRTLDVDLGRQDETHFVQAYILRSKGKYKEAIGEINKAIQVNKNEDLLLLKELLARRQSKN